MKWVTPTGLDRVHGRRVRRRGRGARGRGLERDRPWLLLHGTEDHYKLELETPMYDALYASC